VGILPHPMGRFATLAERHLQGTKMEWDLEGSKDVTDVKAHGERVPSGVKVGWKESTQRRQMRLSSTDLLATFGNSMGEPAKAP
jgi:hypothetical protein